MFEKAQMIPPDPILSLNEAYRADPAPHKINLGAGVYQNDAGETPILECVRAAEGRLLANAPTKIYLPISGSPEYDLAVQSLLFAAEDPIRREDRLTTAQTPGGTGALRIAAELVAHLAPGATVWLSDPTWVNHEPLFAAAGLTIRRYPYFHPDSFTLQFDELLASMASAQPGDVLLVQGSCHNPTGEDLTREQWERLAETVASAQLLPIFDFAYQGFGEGLDEDAYGLRLVASQVSELMIASSFSKTFGLYNERVGALTLVSANAEKTRTAKSVMERLIRTTWSNPPAHGARIVATVFGDSELTALWARELAGMRARLVEMRALLHEHLDRRGLRLGPNGNQYLTRQRGMFSYTRLGPDAVEALRRNYSIYVVGSGRINVAGLTPANVERLVEALASVLD